MRKQRYGRIINLSSMLAIHGGPFDICYSATKGAINSITKSLAREVGGYGITVNSICPSLVDTDLSSEYLRQAGPYGRKMKKIWDELRPIKRDLLPEDIANVAAFLGSEESAYVNGQILQLDGGMT
jgi:3-oxoacyl-[acyl-carrier protein] reductase